MNKPTQEELDLINKWKRNSLLYEELKKERSFVLKLELPSFKLTQVITDDVEDAIVGSTLEAFKKTTKEMKLVNESLTNENENLQRVIEDYKIMLKTESLKVAQLNARGFWSRVFNW